MKRLVWRVYRVTEERELVQALARYELATGEKPVWAQVSKRAPENLLLWVKRTGLEVVQAKSILPHDVWLTHETGAVKHQPQLSLFGEARK